MAAANVQPLAPQELAAIGCIEHPADRYVGAHRAAEQVALLVISASPGRVRGRHDVWELLARRAPHLAEWAAFFGYLSTRVQVVAAGSGPSSGNVRPMTWCATWNASSATSSAGCASERQSHD